MKESVDLRGVISDGYNADPNVPVFVPCIYHRDRSRPNLAVYPDHVYCYTCSKYATASDFLMDYWHVDFQEMLKRLLDGDYPKITEVAHAENLLPVDPTLVESYRANLKLNPTALAYLKGRGLAPGTIAVAKLGHSGTAYTIPVYDASGNCTNIRFRRDDAATQFKDGPKYWSLPGRKTMLYGVERIIPGKTIVLCEGEFDSLIATQLGYCGVSFTNGKNAMLQEALPLLAKGDKVVVAYDQDVASANRPLEIAPILHQTVESIYIARWPLRMGKDISEVFVRMGDATVKEIIENAKLWRGYANQSSYQRRGVAAASR